MLEFKEIDLSDRQWINSLLGKSDFMGCEYSFANNMAWRRLGDSKICRYKDFYISCSYKDGKPVFTFPSGEGDYKDLIKNMQEYSNCLGYQLTITSVNNQSLSILNTMFPNEFTYEKDEDSYDYIYNAHDLIELNGKKYHQKRNHISKFKQNNNWRFEPINKNNQDECIEFSAMTYNKKNNYDDLSSVSEQFAIDTFFTNFEALDLIGGILRADEKIIAFTIGEKINTNTFCIHIEKAISEIQGSYATINNEFVKFAASDCLYINREEDLGIEGLRKSKHSYYPCFLYEKSIITFK